MRGLPGKVFLARLSAVVERPWVINGPYYIIADSQILVKRLQFGRKGQVIFFLIAYQLPVDLDRRLTCLCGHPNYRKPLDFGTLVGADTMETA